MEPTKCDIRRWTSAPLVAVLMLWNLYALAATDRKGSKTPHCGSVISLDGNDWLLATDPHNAGRAGQWFNQPVPEAKQTKVPWIIQDVFPDYHGAVWYWRYVEAPTNPHTQGRYLLRFWAVDYQAEVWVNGIAVGNHEGGETPFSLDVTIAIKQGAKNLIAVRVLNPSDEPIDGIPLKQTPHRNKTSAFSCGSDYDHGGIEDSVDLLVEPAVRIEDLFVTPEVKTGVLSIRATVRNNTSKPVKGTVELTVSPATGGEAIAVKRIERRFNPGVTLTSERWQVEGIRLWELNDPFLYRLAVKVTALESVDEQSVRCGFRDFRFENGYFRLNGRRLLLRSSVSGNMTPIGIHVPYDAGWLRRDLINSKVMGFNAIRFYGLPTRFQLELCDELGLMVYEEPYSSQLYEDSPQMVERFDRSTREMILRDRNHPSVVIWGLLNETGDSPQFRHAVQTLPLVRSLDESRMVLLSSGRFDAQLGIGSIANPGVDNWEYLLGAEKAGAAATKATSIPAYIENVGDAHVYPWVPHTAAEIRFLRNIGHDTKPVFISEYGIASALDLPRMVRQYEQRGKESCGEAMFYRQALNKFMADWERWRMADCFGRPEEYFKQCLAQMAGQRLLGINALRANPNIAGFDLTGTADQGYTGEGLTTAFREPKPGTVDAMFDGLAPLRWCLFAEPANVYRGKSVALEAVLANEDALLPGDYPVALEVFGTNGNRVFERKLKFRVPGPHGQSEPALVLPVFSEHVVADWPAGKYRWVCTFEQGAAAAGGEAEFYVLDPAEMPKVEAEVVLWGEDADLLKWLTEHNINVRQFNGSPPKTRELILVGSKPAVPGGAAEFKEIVDRIERGSTAVFLNPNVLATSGQAANLSLLGKTGTLVSLPNNVYHKDDWSKSHPIFDGLPTGGLLDYTFYRELISNVGWSRPDAPTVAVAGSIYAFTAYSSALLISVDELGAGRLILNTLAIRENLGKSPAAERLLRNLLRWAAPDTSKPPAEQPLLKSETK